MDGQAFDQFTRRVGTLVTRRTGLRALVAGAIAVLGQGSEPAAAALCLRTGSLCGPLTGRSCARCCSKRSRPVGRPIPGRGRRRRCAKALTDPTPGPSCIPAGQDGCFDAESCCAGASCRGDEVCRTGACKTPGQACPNGSAACCFGATCAGNGQCCGVLNGPCASVTDCCGTLECSAGGQCVQACVAGGENCVETSDCCLGSSCVPDAAGNACCLRPGEPCSGGDLATPCCAESDSAGCTAAGVCGPCGNEPGAPCQTDADCCTGLDCDGTTCQPL